ncbi:MAG: IS110 family transposase [Actinomycetota bacterium]|nr:IS110 family transposase [Actinomycetota bacterium]
MVTIGVDPHKQTHTAAAVNELGVELEHQTAPARPTGNEQLLQWARGLNAERVWAVEDVRNVSGSLERFLIDRGEIVVRLAPQLMAGARRGVRTRGKSDPIDALAIARAALREGVESLPTARLAGPEREIRMLALYRERLLDMRTRLVNELRWQLHDLWPEWEIPAKALTQPGWQTKVASRLARAEQTVQIVIARDMIRRARELSRATKDLYEKIAALVKAVAPQLLAEPGIGVLLAAKFIGEIAGIDRFTTDAQLARLAGCAPIPVSSGRTDRFRLDPGGNRRLNSAFYMLAIIRIRTDPRTAIYLQRQRANGKSKKEAIRCLKRHLVRRVYHLLRDPQSVPTTICLT